MNGSAALVTGIAHRFALALAVLVTDQQLTSESDRPFEPFTADLRADQRLSASSFREALGFAPSRRVDLAPAASFFESVIASAHDAGDARGVEAWSLVELVMRRTLGRLVQVRVRGDGVVEVPFYLAGRLDGGPLVGLRSIAIET